MDVRDQGHHGAGRPGPRHALPQPGSAHKSRKAGDPALCHTFHFCCLLRRGSRLKSQNGTGGSEIFLFSLLLSFFFLMEGLKQSHEKRRLNIKGNFLTATGAQTLRSFREGRGHKDPADLFPLQDLGPKREGKSLRSMACQVTPLQPCSSSHTACL